MFEEKFKIIPENIPNGGIMFANMEKELRSSHLGHAMIEYAPGKVFAFYPNCSSEDDKYKGHSGYGWMEYKRSEDGGDSWSEPICEPNSKALFDADCGRTLMCEKAVVTDTGRIVLFYLHCDVVTNGHVWDPRLAPMYAISDDTMESVSEPKFFCYRAGRIFDALYHNGVIYVLIQTGEHCEWKGSDEEMQLYVSEDNGETFKLRSTVGFTSIKDCFYGTMTFTPDGRLLVYIYDLGDEYNARYIVSSDLGYTWDDNRRAFFKKRIRNPQIVYFGGRYLMHGRSGSRGEPGKSGNFVLYSSKDGETWDEGRYLCMRTAGAGAYSNNLLVHLPNGKERLIIQTSHAYLEHRTNVLMYFVEEI